MTATAPYARPLAPGEFSRVLGIGLGRAILVARAQPSPEIRAAILDACTRTTAYDPQLEDSRARYLFDAIEASGEVESYLAPILAALARATAYWTVCQLRASGCGPSRAAAGPLRMGSGPRRRSQPGLRHV